MKKTKAPARGILLPLLASLCLCGAAPAQPSKKFEPTPARAAEAARLRGALAGALGEDFGLARDGLARRSDWHGGGLYWLAHLRARRAGEFHVAYKYRYNDRVGPRDPLYTFVERRTLVRVGPRGCARRPRHNFVCVGDTVILPVVVDDYTGHAFSLTRQPFTPGDAASAKILRDAEDGGLDREPVANPAGEFLRYVGRRGHYFPHRAGGYTMTFEATFEAVKPGSFNLAVGTRVSPAGPPTAAEAAASDVSVPVVIVAPGRPVTVLSSGEDVHGYTERFSSRSGENYRTTPLVLQTGERITLKYSGYSRRGRSPGERRESPEALVKEHAPVITLLPFRVEPAQDFNEWVVDFLPPSRRE